jgi:menaquinone-dependent protoporphyrinogen oxidase
MKVLVTAASKYGGTRGIAEAIGKTLEESGHTAVVIDPDVVGDLEGYDAVVLGSGVYMGRWMVAATSIADRLASHPHPTWLFSSGPVGEPPSPEEVPADVAQITELIGARGHRLFGGKLFKSELGFAERAVVTALRAPEGDFRDWDAIAAWARRIAAELDAAD